MDVVKLSSASRDVLDRGFDLRRDIVAAMSLVLLLDLLWLGVSLLA